MNENLKCPMCDSTELKQENGYYVCQICGNKIPIPSQKREKPKKVIQLNRITAIDLKIIKVLTLAIESALFLGGFFTFIANLQVFRFFAYMETYEQIGCILNIFFCLTLLSFIVFTIIEWKKEIIPIKVKRVLFVLCYVSLILPQFIATFSVLIQTDLYAWETFTSTFFIDLAITCAMYLIVFQCPKWIKHYSEKPNDSSTNPQETDKK